MLTNPSVIDTDDEMKKEILHMRLSAEEKAMIADLRRAEDDLPTMSELMRRLIKRAHGKLKKDDR